MKNASISCKIKNFPNRRCCQLIELMANSRVLEVAFHPEVLLAGHVILARSWRRTLIRSKNVWETTIVLELTNLLSRKLVLRAP